MGNNQGLAHPSRPSVAELLDGKHHFIMPSYQRGYRWDEKQVIELLEDLRSYVTDKSEGDYYLQPLVCQYDEESGKWIVLDGQQRLTTIWLILNYLDWYNKSTLIYTLEREINRAGQTGSQMISISNLNPCNDIQSYYIWEANNIIHEWFQNLGKPGKRITNEIEYALTDDTNEKQVRFIWYEQGKGSSTVPTSISDSVIASAPSATSSEATYDSGPSRPQSSNSSNSSSYSNPSNYSGPSNSKELREIENIRFFNRLNNGKISLTSAELIKALLILAFERQKSDITEREISEESLIQEWDRMESRLQDDKFAAILSRNYKDYGCRMDILFDFITLRSEESEKDHAYQLYQKLFDSETHPNSSDSYPIPEFWLDKGILSIKDAWQHVKSMFDMICQWYNDSNYYHYIGFLVHCGKDNSIDMIYSELSKAKQEALNQGQKWTSRKKLQALRKLVVRTLDMKQGENVDEYLESLEFGDHRIRRVLLLFNIEIYCKSYGFRFDFDAFNVEKWDIEHISARNKERLQKRQEQLGWLKQAQTILASMKENEEALKLAQEIEAFVKSKEEEGEELTQLQKPYQNFYARVRNLFLSQSDREVEENSIDNLTLLNSSINREYKDDPFFFKRQTIIDKDRQGMKFIPIGTRNVFLKYYSDSTKSASHLDLMKWSVDDGANYRQAIADTLKNFIREAEKEYEC